MFCVYVPPSSDIDVYDAVIKCIQHVSSEICGMDDEVLVLGDFNLPNVDWNESLDGDYYIPFGVTSEIEKQFLDGISARGLRQINSIKTKINRILDLIFVSSELDCCVIRSNNFIVSEDHHHPSILLKINCDIKSMLPIDGLYGFDFVNADFNKLNHKLDLIDWNCLDNYIFDFALICFYNLIFDCFLDVIPLKCFSRKSCDHIWYDGDLGKLCNQRNRAWKLFCKSGSECDLACYHNLCSRFGDIAMLRYSSYISKIELDLKRNPSGFWKYINDKRGSHIYPTETRYGNAVSSDPDSIGNLFCQFFKLSYDNCNNVTNNLHVDNIQSFEYLAGINLFINESDVSASIMKCKNKYSYGPDGIPSAVLKGCVNALSLPLSILFNKSLSSCSFPDIWKTSYIIPIYKKGGRGNVCNYRPVARLSSIPKIFEEIITTAISFHVKSVICPEQHGCVSGRSTTTNLLDFVTYYFEKFNSKTQVDCVFTDFSKAFDKLPHSVLLSKLLAIGFGSNFVSWVESYLLGRTCRVLFGDILSTSYKAISGVPQGSHLGPILFILFVNDLPSVFKYSECKIYADDVKIYRSIESLFDSRLLQIDLDAFYDWCLRNGMFLNIDKCKVMNFTRKNSTLIYSYQFNGIMLDNIDKTLDLGVYIDRKPHFGFHIDYIVSRANSVMEFIYCESRELTDPYCIRALFYAILRSILEYACPVSPV